MSDTETTATSSDQRKKTLKERAKDSRKAAYQKAKERRKAYLASPEGQALMAARKAAVKASQRKKQDGGKAKTKARNAALKTEQRDAEQHAKAERQELKDAELRKLIKPALTLLQGGASADNSKD